MIKRSPRPDSGFLLIRNDVVRDRRLSYRARGLLCAMLSYPDNWQFNRDWLAGQSDGEGQQAVRTALQELERHGYLKRERRKDPDTGKFGWEHVVYDTPQSAGSVFAGGSTGRESTDGIPPAGFPPSKEQLSRTTVEEDELNSPHSGRFAPSVGALENSETNSEELTSQVPAPRTPMEDGESWRELDRQAFADHLGERLRSDGTRWNKGEWSSRNFYDAYRKKWGKRKKLDWPGRYIQRLADDRMDAVDDWLLAEGLERVNQP